MMTELLLLNILPACLFKAGLSCPMMGMASHLQYCITGHQSAVHENFATELACLATLMHLHHQEHGLDDPEDENPPSPTAEQPLQATGDTW